MKNISTVSIALLISFVSFAQGSTKKIQQLQDVVVTGQYSPQSAKNSVYQVRVISAERIRKQAATKLQDVLNAELNVRFSQDLATGGSGISMLGLSGQYVKILIDGMPMAGRQGTSNEIDINQLDVNSIERIEIVEGPMSVVYGADALAGVINIITKKPALSKLAVTARLHEETIGKEYGLQQGIHNQHAGLTWKYKNWEAGGSFGHNYFGGWRDTAEGRELLWHTKDQLVANGFIGWHNAAFNIRYRIDGLDEIITDPGNFLNYNREAGDTLAYDREYLSQRLMHQLQAGYIANTSLSFQVQAAYTDFTRQVFGTTVSKKTGDVRLNTAPASQSMDEFAGFTFRGTALYKISDRVSLQPGVEFNRESGEGERLKTGTNTISDYAFFISSEIKPTGWVNLRPGVRFVKNSVYEAEPFIPSINTKFILSKELDLRLAYAKGFRAPSLRELYYNFFDANHQITGNPGLESETSKSFTGSLNWKPAVEGVASFSAALTGFLTDVKNLIDIGMSPNDPNVFTYINVARYKSRGATLTASLQYKNLNASLGGSYTGRYNAFAETNKLLPDFKWSAEINSTIGYRFPSIGLDANLFFKYTGKLPYYQLIVVNGQEQVRLAELSGYSWADLSINKKLGRLITLNTGIRNLFDVVTVNNSAVTGGVHSTTGARPIGYGRSFFAGILFNWNGNK